MTKTSRTRPGFGWPRRTALDGGTNFCWIEFLDSTGKFRFALNGNVLANTVSPSAGTYYFVAVRRTHTGTSVKFTVNTTTVSDSTMGSNRLRVEVLDRQGG